jgi:GT2 family glycosyltransferase
MKRHAERIRSRPGRLRQIGDQLTGGGLRALAASLLQRARHAGNRMTGGGLRALAASLLQRARHAGNRMTGGGLRNLSRKLSAKALRSAMDRPVIKSFARRLLQPFPQLSARLYRMASPSGGAAVPTVPSQALQQDLSLWANSLYRTAFGRTGDPSILVNYSRQLEEGVPLERLAEQFTISAEFLTRHGRDQGVNTRYVSALYRDGLGRSAKVEDLAIWLKEKERGITRAKVLAALAKSDEALERLHSRALDSDAPYHRWVRENDTLSDLDRTVIRTHIAVLPACPLISVIMPLGEAAEIVWRKSLNSVITQLYPYWELFICTDERTASSLRAIVDALEEPRIQVSILNGAEGWVAVANAALSSASGEFVTILEGGDILAEQALYEAALELGKAEFTDIIYTDNDLVDCNEQRSNPWFKPDWDPDLLLAQDYITHLAVYRRRLVEEVGLLRSGLEGAAFHDLALRAAAATTADRVRHIPAILCHRRSEENVFPPENAWRALRAPALTYRVVRDYLDVQGFKDAIVAPSPLIHSCMRVIWPVPSSEPMVSVIIPTRDQADLLLRCVEGVLHRTEYSNLELLIVDNGSVQKETLQRLTSLSESDVRVRILRRPGPFNYAALNNSAASEAQGEVLLLLNDDTHVIGSGWLREMVSQAIRPDVGLVGAKLLYPNEEVQHAGIVLGPQGYGTHFCRLAQRNDTGYFGQLAMVRTLSAVTGACAAIRRAVFFEVGGLDAVNFPEGFSDIDFCLRLGDYGYRVLWTPFAELFHLENASSGSDMANPARSERTLRELDQLRETWGPLVKSWDSFDNPNLLFARYKFDAPSPPHRPKPWLPVFEEVFKLRQRFADPQQAI